MGGKRHSRLISRTQYLNSQSIVIEVSETISLTLKDFHFGMEALGNDVVAREVVIELMAILEASRTPDRS
jgi:hypothetical protein